MRRGDDGTIAPWSGATDIFITPGYRFRAVDALMTNFHLPRSTLFMLVSAFAGLETMRAAYAPCHRQPATASIPMAMQACCFRAEDMTMDDDLPPDGAARADRRGEQLRAGIRKHRDSTGHDLCWHHPDLWAAVAEKSGTGDRGAAMAEIHARLHPLPAVAR